MYLLYCTSKTTDTTASTDIYLVLYIGSSNNHPPLIPICQFEQVQEEKLRRSNIHRNTDGTITRNPTHYSMKSDSDRSKSL